MTFDAHPRMPQLPPRRQRPTPSSRSTVPPTAPPRQPSPSPSSLAGFKTRFLYKETDPDFSGGLKPSSYKFANNPFSKKGEGPNLDAFRGARTGKRPSATTATTPTLTSKVAGKPYQSGMASYYGGGRDGFNGKPTASGEKFNDQAMTCAHPSLPFGTQLRVKYNGRSAIVRVNDRGPFHGGRVIDLSHGAAKALGMEAAGVGKVDIYKV